MKHDYLCPDCGKRIATYDDDAESEGVFCWCKSCRGEKEIKIENNTRINNWPLEIPEHVPKSAKTYWDRCPLCQMITESTHPTLKMKYRCVPGGVSIFVSLLEIAHLSNEEFLRIINLKMEEACHYCQCEREEE